MTATQPAIDNGVVHAIVDSVIRQYAAGTAAPSIHQRFSGVLNRVRQHRPPVTPPPAVPVSVANDFLIDEPTAMKRLGISRSTIYRWRQTGKVEAVPMQDSDMVRYRNSDIDAIIQARRQKTADTSPRPIAIGVGSR